MTHRMMLVSHDFTKVHSIVVARRRQAGVAQVEERIFRTDEVGASIASTGSTEDYSERLAEID